MVSSTVPDSIAWHVVDRTLPGTEDFTAGLPRAASVGASPSQHPVARRKRRSRASSAYVIPAAFLTGGWHVVARKFPATFFSAQDYIERFYNSWWMHSALDYKCPTQYERDCPVAA